MQAPKPQPADRRKRRRVAVAVAVVDPRRVVNPMEASFLIDIIAKLHHFMAADSLIPLMWMWIFCRYQLLQKPTVLQRESRVSTERSLNLPPSFSRQITIECTVKPSPRHNIWARPDEKSLTSGSLSFS